MRNKDFCRLMLEQEKQKRSNRDESTADLYRGKYPADPVYPASDPSDFCMAAQDAPFPSACRKAGEKSDEQK